MLQVRLLACPVYAEVSDLHAPSYWCTSERLRWETLTTPSQRTRFMMARGLLRDLLIQRWGGQPSDWPLTAEANQPPSVSGRSDCYLSLSHSAHYLLAALGDAPVGVDIETHGRPRPIEAMAEQVCHPEEHTHLSQQPAPQAQQTFLRYWTRKEAWLKARGQGLDFSLMARLRYREAPIRAANLASWQSKYLTLSVFGAELATMDYDWQIPAQPNCLGYGVLQLVNTRH